MIKWTPAPIWEVRVLERDGERWGGEERREREKVSSGMLEARRRAHFHFMAVRSHGAGGELARIRMG